MVGKCGRVSRIAPMDAIRHVNGRTGEEAPRGRHLIACAPFALPTTGVIAVEVIDHCGDEALKVYEAI
jgi:hypothetical protein